MNWKILGLFVFALMIIPSVSAQSTAPTIGPDSDITIVCDADNYYPDIFGNVDIFCTINNTGGSTKNEKVGAIFDDWKIGEEVELNDVYTKENGLGDWVSIKPNMNKNKPDVKKTKQLSQQNIQTQSGQTTEIWFSIKVPFGSSGKFDIVYGEGASEYKLDPWWNATWVNRKQINLTVNDGSTLTDFQIKMYIDKEDNMTSDYSDLRFLNNCSDDAYEVPYYMESNQTNFTVMWVKAPVINGSVCMYWGNPIANSTSNGSAVFELFEDFDLVNPITWTELDPNGQIVIDTSTDERLEWVTWQSIWVDSWVYTNHSFDPYVAEGVLVEVVYHEETDANAFYTFTDWHNIIDDSLATNNRTGFLEPGGGGGQGRVQSSGRFNDVNNAGPQYLYPVPNTFHLTLKENPLNRNVTFFAEKERVNVVAYSNYTYSNNRPIDMDYFFGISSYSTANPTGFRTGYIDDIKVAKNHDPYPEYTPGSVEVFSMTIPAPNIDYVSPTPANGTTLTVDNFQINVSNDVYIYSTCILDFNGVNETVNSSGMFCFFNKTGLTEQDYTFRAYANASGGVDLNATEERIVSVVLSGPSITINDPSGTYTLPTGNTTYEVPVNHNIIDALLDSCWYNIGSGNVTLSTCENTTLILPQGSYTFELYANNTAGFESMQSSSFSVSLTAPINLMPNPFGAVAGIVIVAGFIIFLLFMYTQSGANTEFFIKGTIGAIIVLYLIGYLLTGTINV